MAKTQPSYMPWIDFKSRSPRKPHFRSDDLKALMKTKPRRKARTFTLTLICDEIVGSKRKGSLKFTDFFPEFAGRTMTFTNKKGTECDPLAILWLEKYWVNTLSGRQSGF